MNTQTPTDGPAQPGDNPNARNSKTRGVRPKVKNNSPKTQQSMRFAWADPLSQVNVVEPLGLEPNPEIFAAGEMDLTFELPTTISEPFSDLVTAVGDRINLATARKDIVAESIHALSYFKAARQLYSTMLDSEKSFNQPLKAIYYDETPIPMHMSGALGIIGHIDSKVGKVVIRNASTLFKRWIVRGLQLAPGANRAVRPLNGRNIAVNPPVVASQLIWPEVDGKNLAFRLAREMISTLTDQRYTVNVGGNALIVSMPKLVDQTLNDYYGQINDNVPNHAAIRDLVALLEMDLAAFRNGNIGRGRDFARALGRINLVMAPNDHLAPELRSYFEEWISEYTVDTKPDLEAILKCGPPPAGTNGFGAQTVQASDTTARWQYPLSDADVNIGFLFSPSSYFSLKPKIVGYAKRTREIAAAAFAQQDGRAFV